MSTRIVKVAGIVLTNIARPRTADTSDQMNKLLMGRLSDWRYSRLLLYGALLLIATALCIAYVLAKRADKTDRYEGESNWTRNVASVDSPIGLLNY